MLTTIRTARVALFLLLALALAFAGVPVRADSDQDRARAAVLAGQVLPLGTVLERLAREHPGQVLKVELESDRGRWIYEVRMLQSGGRLTQLHIDAATGETLARRDKGRDRDGTERR